MNQLVSYAKVTRTVTQELRKQNLVLNTTAEAATTTSRQRLERYGGDGRDNGATAGLDNGETGEKEEHPRNGTGTVTGSRTEAEEGDKVCASQRRAVVQE